jgi:hypothetical protein
MIMNKVITVDASATLDEAPGERIVRIHIADGGMVPWTMGLCMLKEQVVESASFRATHELLVLQVVRGLGIAEGRMQPNKHSSVLNLRISEVELDLWVHFCLCFLRDGYGAVDHLDIDFDLPSEPRTRGTLVLHFSRAADSVSQSEALSRLRRVFDR